MNFEGKVHQQTETQAEQLNLQTSFLYTALPCLLVDLVFNVCYESPTRHASYVDSVPVILYIHNFGHLPMKPLPSGL